MRTSPALLGTAALLAAATAACSSGGSSSSSAGSAFDPKNCQGGTLYVLNQSDATAHHLDPARIYTSGGGAITSLIFRTLTTRHRVPGAGRRPGRPDLATDTGTASDGAKTWTYHLKDGLKFDDGTPITSKDIKWGVERAFAPELPGGIPYLRDWLAGGADYTGSVQGQGAGLDPDAGRQDDHLQAAQARGRLPLRGDGDAVRPGAEGQGRRHQL